MNPNTKNLRIFLAPLAALVSLTLSTCTEPVSTQCPTGVVCPAGKKCAAKQPVCIVENCGDGVKQDGELCDDGNIVSGDGCSFDCLSTESCGNGVTDVFLVTDSVSGSQKPKEACDDGNTADGDGCSADCQSNELCGNGIVDRQVGEICDDGNKDYGDGCSGDCLSNETCGNGYADIKLEGEKREVCDDGNAEAGDGCTPDCKSKEECGNGYVDFNESCDDGDRTSGDGCSGDCRSDETCGNGYTDTFIDPVSGKAKEVCDDGNTISGDGCSDTCKSKEECGNNILDPIRINPETGATETLEVCDDGNRVSGDFCSADCKSTELCGNGYVDSVRGELCDDGNNANGDGCSENCRSTEFCGNNIVDPVKLNPETGALEPFEVCDNGNNASGDGCSADCKSDERCGNGTVDTFIVNGKPKEVCDDGNNESGDACSADCQSDGSCGNSYVDVSEQCDSGGYNTQQCDSDCTVAYCGDGFTNAARLEACDDAGESATCDPDCTQATCGDRYWNATAGEACDTGGNSQFCDSDCTAPRCGDGLLNAVAGELCDDGDNDSGDGCSADCRSTESCGNGYVDSYLVLNPTTGQMEPAEVCDDRNTQSGDGCSSNCKSNETCGNGIVDTAKGETCDDGNTNDGDECAGNCKSTGNCGNLIIDVGEQCDDGNSANTDDCVVCKNAYCGDGFTNFSGAEQCDTAGASDTCNTNCTLSVCGDGIVNPADAEQCDPGAAGESVNCNNDCTVAFCGDGKTNTTRGEVCDDAGPSLDCNANCTRSVCGDGILNPTDNEACDPGSAGETRYCDSDCTPSSCGDGLVNAAADEQCDDANQSNEDACRTNCQRNVCGDGLVNSAINPATSLPFEACDDANTTTETSCPYGEATCTACNESCTAVLTLSGSFCGNGVKDSGEVCDDGDNVTETECDYGTPNCTLCDSTCKTALALVGRYCGDNSRNDTSETCDDGNTVDETACPYGQTSCTTCNATCSGTLTPSTVTYCGDGTKNGPENCDDGDTVSETECDYGTRTCSLCDASCSTVLSLTGRYCGDGSINAAGEKCDDGNNTDETSCPYGQPGCTTCNADCTATISPTTVSYCGDGSTQTGVETCDDGNTVTEFACEYSFPTCVKCDSSCSTVLNLTGRYCGDTLTTDGETCDDGNSVTETECVYNTASCTICEAGCRSTRPGTGRVCGDNVVDPEEVCDDHNTVSETACDYGTPSCEGCASDCRTVLSLVGPYCSDNIKNGAEACDDGNTTTESECPYGTASCTVCAGDCLSTPAKTGRVCGDGTDDPEEACDDRNALACGTCSANCQQVQLAKASGSITTVGSNNLNEGQTFTLNDGINPAVVFEFDKDGWAPAGRVRLWIKNKNSNEIAVIIRDGVNAQADSLRITATASGATVSLVHDLNGSFGNQTISESVSNTGFVVSGMSGGKGVDCAQGTACSQDNDCVRGLECSTVSRTCEVPSVGLVVAKSGNGSGTVSTEDLSIDCGTDCGMNCQSGDVVTLTATPAAGSSFTGWSGGGCSGTGTCTVTVTDDTTVTASFALNPYTIGGTVSGLAGSGLKLKNNGADEISVAADGSFTFPATILSGSPYVVTVSGQPTVPTQVCTVTNGSGTVGAANITTVQVTCVTSSYTVGGTVSGLAGSGLVLQNNAGDDLQIAADGSFTFATPVLSNASYAVTVKTQPSTPTQDCVVTGGTGTVVASNVTNVSVVCTTSSFTIGGTVTGLSGSGLKLQNNGGDDLAISVDGSFTFATPVLSNAGFVVTVLVQPSGPKQTCSVTGGSGTVGGANVTDVQITCATKTFKVGGSVSGLETGATVVLQNNGGNDLSVAANGTFTFTTEVASGGSYAVTVKTQPTNPTQLCTVTNGSGAVVDADITTVQVTCVTQSFKVGGTVSGLVASTGKLVLQNAGGDNLTIEGDGSFAFTTSVLSGLSYDVTVFAQPSDPTQTCVVVDTTGTGTVGGADVASVQVTCTTNRYTVGVTVSGLTGTGLVLTNNGTDDLAASADGSYPFANTVPSGGAYAVAVKTQPVGQTCTVASGSGTVGSANVTVAVSCVAETYSIGGSVTGLSGTLVLQNGTDEVTIAGDSTFAFPVELVSGASYAVTVRTQPTGQTCSVANGSGSVGTANVTNVTVTCVATTYTLTVTKTGSGTVSSSPAGIDCGATCSYTFTSTDTVTLTATATAPAVFAGWSGEGCSGTGTCVLTMSAARSVSALFTVCGDGTKEGLEACDDNNTTAGDGCSATCEVETGFTCSGTPLSACYPAITVDGTKDEVWSNTTVVGADTSSVGLPSNTTPGERISAVRVTNDATNLYVLVEAFDDTWNDSKPAYLHLYFVIGGADGTITADGVAGTSITFAAANVNPSYLGRFKSDLFAATEGVEGVVDAGKATSGYAELRIPLASLGAPAAGQTVGLIVGYRGDDTKPGFSDIAPYKASALSDWGDSASAVDPTAAEYFSYTVR